MVAKRKRPEMVEEIGPNGRRMEVPLPEFPVLRPRYAVAARDNAQLRADIQTFGNEIIAMGEDLSQFDLEDAAEQPSAGAGEQQGHDNGQAAGPVATNAAVVDIPSQAQAGEVAVGGQRVLPERSAPPPRDDVQPARPAQERQAPPGQPGWQVQQQPVPRLDMIQREQQAVRDMAQTRQRPAMFAQPTEAENLVACITHWVRGRCGPQDQCKFSHEWRSGIRGNPEFKARGYDDLPPHTRAALDHEDAVTKRRQDEQYYHEPRTFVGKGGPRYDRRGSGKRGRRF